MDKMRLGAKSGKGVLLCSNQFSVNAGISRRVLIGAMMAANNGE